MVCALGLALVIGYGPYVNSRDATVGRICVQDKRFKPQLQRERNTKKAHRCPLGLPNIFIHPRSNDVERGPARAVTEEGPDQ